MIHKCPPIYLTNAPFVNGVLYLNGIYEHSFTAQGTPRGGFRAIASVPGLNYQSFTIGLDFFPLNSKRPRPLRAFEAKLNEWTRGYYRRWVADRLGRPVPPENFLTGGAGYRWLGFKPGTNGLELTLNNQNSVTNSMVRLFESANGIICSALSIWRANIS
jgi:hypothetical protein